MTYFGYPLDIRGWETKPETEPDRFQSPEPENHGWKMIPKPEPTRTETRGYPIRNRPAAILTPKTCQGVLLKHLGPRTIKMHF